MDNVNLKSVIECLCTGVMFFSTDGSRPSDHSTSRDSSIPPSSLNGYVYDPHFLSQGQHKMPLLMNNNGKLHAVPPPLSPCYETLDGVAGELSEYLDCSVVHSEFVTQYMQEDLQVRKLHTNL